MQDGIHVDIESLLNIRNIAADYKLGHLQKSKSLVDGNARSMLKGRGMEFADVRQYQPGDDIRNIDWRITARTQITHTKLFEEEKERPVIVLVDQRAAMFFGSKVQFKSVAAANIAAFIAWCAFHNRDRLGALLFSDNEQADIRPKLGKRALLAFINRLAAFNCSLKSPLSGDLNADISLSLMIRELRRMVRPGSLIYLISDFHDFDAGCAKHLTILARHNDLEFIHISDPIEAKLPRQASLNVTNGQTRTSINGLDKNTRSLYEKKFSEFAKTLRSSAHDLNANYRHLTTADALTHVARTHFSPRTGRKRK